MRQLVSIKTDGSFDSSFNYNYLTKKGNAAANGSIADAAQGSDGNIVAVGNFTTYNGTPASHIVKVNAMTGLADAGFNSGAGANGAINRISYNATTKKYMICGLFTAYNGQPASGVAMINEDGSLVSTFMPKAIAGGNPYFVKQWRDNLIILAGDFTSYGGVSRPGFAILNADGNLAAGYNNTGTFSGSIRDMVETTSLTTGQPAAYLVGNFSRFDATQVYNIVKIVIEN